MRHTTKANPFLLRNTTCHSLLQQSKRPYSAAAPLPYCQFPHNPCMADNDFTCIHTFPIPNLTTEGQIYRHPSGAVHVHFANHDPHRAFCLGFRTSPEDSSGLPHILEHTALCGSRKYPIRDPFFMMLRRSLQTFMNAMTYPDRTCYPFATQNQQDFFNLLDIYLDAAFDPLLDVYDFAQEGWRLAPEGDGWAIKGVVYNEMKGAMADSDSMVSDALAAALLPDTCYRHNSGGDPRHIPDLQHEDLVAFHRRTYCAANACFTTWGDLDLERVQSHMAAYCQRFPGTAVAIPALQQPLRQRQDLRISVPLAQDQDPRDVTMAGIAWIGDDSAQLDAVLQGELCESLLLGHAAAPLRLALEQSLLGRSIDGSGYMAYMRNGSFHVEMHGVDVNDGPIIHKLIDDTLERIANDGFSGEEIASALHQLELRRRSIGGDGAPLGLQQGLRAIGTWCCNGDIAAALDQEQALQRLRHTASDPDFWPQYLRRWFINNPHCATYNAIPDTQMSARTAEAEAALVAKKLEVCDNAQRQQLRTMAETLQQRQEQDMDLSILPNLQLEDIPAQRACSDGAWVKPGVRVFQAATGGLLYCTAAFPLGTLNDGDLAVLPMLRGAIGNLGFGSHDYQDTARLLEGCCGGISAQLHLHGDGKDPSQVSGILSCSIYGLADRYQEWLPLLPQVISEQRFDEHNRIKELLAMSLSGLNEQIIGRGHSVAALAAQRSFPGMAGIGHRLSGLGRREILRHLLGPDGDIPGYAAQAQALLQRICTNPPSLALVSDLADPESALTCLSQSWSNLPPDTPPAAAWWQPHPIDQNCSASAFTTSTPINFNAMAIPTVPGEHEDAAALAVSCRLLTHEQLHRNIREQGGAYGASASYQAKTASVVLTSYRDPRLQDTFKDLGDGLLWLRDCPATAAQLKEAKLSLIAGIDNPGSPTGEALRRFLGDLSGNTPERINRYRQRIIAVTVEDIHAVAQRYLNPAAVHRATITSNERAEQECADTSWTRAAL
ncbi:MAG: hypothetical protein EA401_06150 [Planctomycetota bacterium]|nr:MAG: hypothetical protein EA401_06150 [Planctomycetota bacterium]